MPAYIGITIGGSIESPTPGMAVVVSTTTTTAKDIELVLQQLSPSGAWLDCKAYGLQYVKTTAYAACILGLELLPGIHRLKADGMVLNLKAYLVWAS